jgi:hypothetical protein
MTVSVPTIVRHFIPESDVGDWRPDLVVMRHVLEHLPRPLRVLEEVIHTAMRLDHTLMMYLEVPCFDVGLAHGRAGDLIYEHCSHFTEHSFGLLLDRAGFRTLDQGTAYGGEVVWALVQFEPDSAHTPYAHEAAQFYAQVTRRDAMLQTGLSNLAQQRIAIWGGTGKAAAFMYRHGLDAQRFPLVVDSDPRKVDTYVPGTGQRIVSPDVLLGEPPDAILIATAWRGADIVAEVCALGLADIPCLVVREGQVESWNALPTVAAQES